MLNRLTWVNVSDSTGVKWLNIFHLYGGFFKKTTKISYYLKGSARVVNPPRVEYRGFKLKPVFKGTILRAFTVKTVYNIRKFNGSVIKYGYNSVVLVKKKNITKSKYLLGLITTDLKRKKFIYLFKNKI